MVKLLSIIQLSGLTAFFTGFAIAEEEAGTFAFHESEGEHLTVLWEGEPLLKHMIAFDAGDEERLEITKKVYTHAYGLGGNPLLTKGPGGEFPHHRGLYIGWSKLGFDGKTYDLWHLHKGESQEHREFSEKDANSDTAFFRESILWKGDAQTPVLDEERQIRVYQPEDDGSYKIDFISTLTAAYGDVELDGDPEHAGMQFRAHNEVAENKSARYLFPTEGADPEKERDLPWAALEFALGEKKFNVQHMSHPDLPDDNIYSAYRDYGRFGSFCKTSLKEGESRTFSYRLRIGEGELEGREKYQSAYEAFVKDAAE